MDGLAGAMHGDAASQDEHRLWQLFVHHDQLDLFLRESSSFLAD